MLNRELARRAPELPRRPRTGARSITRTTKRRITISKRALVQRLNRRLRADGARLKGTPGGQSNRRDYRVVDLDGYLITDNVNLVRLARQLGALAPGEVVAL